MLVLTPMMRYSSNARRMRSSASPRVSPQAINLLTIES